MAYRDGYEIVLLGPHHQACVVVKGFEDAEHQFASWCFPWGEYEKIRRPPHFLGEADKARPRELYDTDIVPRCQ